MLKFEYCSPTKIVFGKDTEERTAELIKENGGSRIVIVYGGKSVIESGLLKRIEENLTENGLDFISEGGVIPNPVLSKVREIIKAAIGFKAVLCLL